jgi:hypothetical protein
MPPILTSPSGDQFRTLEEKMEAIAKVSVPSKPRDTREISQNTESRVGTHGNVGSDDGHNLKVCPKMLKRLLRKTSNTSAPGLDGIGWQEVKIWFLLDPNGLRNLINDLIRTGFPPELKLPRVIVIPKHGRRDHTSVKSYRRICLLQTIAKLVEKAITLHLSTRGKLNGWWHLGQHGPRAGRNTSDTLLWLIRRVRENRKNKQHTAVLMVHVSAAFPNTSRDGVKERLNNADPGVTKWVDTWLDKGQIGMEVDENSGPLRSAGSGLQQGSPLSPVLFGLTCGRILKELPDGCSYVDDYAWSIPFDSLSDKNELASEVQRLLNKIQAVFRRHGMELGEKKTELAVIYKANQKRKQCEMEANRWSMRWHDKMIQLNKGNTRWLGYHVDRCLNWHAHVDTCVQRPLWKQQQNSSASKTSLLRPNRYFRPVHSVPSFQATAAPTLLRLSRDPSVQMHLISGSLVDNAVCSAFSRDSMKTGTAIRSVEVGMNVVSTTSFPDNCGWIS